MLSRRSAGTPDDIPAHMLKLLKIYIKIMFLWFILTGNRTLAIAPV